MSRLNTDLITDSRSRLSVLCALAGGLALLVSGCSGDAVGEEPTGNADSSAYVEPEYDGLPADLTSAEVCALLEDEAVAAMLDAEVTKVTPGSVQPDCTWMYRLPGGPATTLHVQVMSMSQTSERLGSEALEWSRDWAPSDVEIFEVASLGVPNMAYEFGASTVVFAIDPVGRVFTVATHSETAEEGRVAIVESVLAALTETHV